MESARPSSRAAKRLVCLDCSWNVENADGENRENVDRAAIDHYVTTGHRIETSNAPRPIGADAGGGRWGEEATAVHGRSDG